MPYLSIVIPVYNSSKYLDECISSILSQSFQDFELLLIDDGSQDDSYAKCDKWRKCDERVSLYSQKNSGPSSARNSGIRKAVGEYVIFIDSDDMIAPGYLEEMVSVQKEHGHTVLVVSTMSEFYGVYHSVHNVEQKKSFMIKKEDFVKLYKMSLLNSPTNKLYSLSILKERNILFPNDMWIEEDLIFNLDYLRNSRIQTFYVIGTGRYLYRKGNDDSLTTAFKRDYYRQIRKGYDALNNLAEECHVSKDDKKYLSEEFHYLLWMALVNNMRQDNPISFWDKIRLNQYIIEQEKFKEIVLQDSEIKKYIHVYVMRAAQSGNFLIMWMTEKFVRMMISIRSLLVREK